MRIDIVHFLYTCITCLGQNVVVEDPPNRRILINSSVITTGTLLYTMHSHQTHTSFGRHYNYYSIIL